MSTTSDAPERAHPLAQAKVQLHIRVPVAVAEYLRVHATYERDVSVARLVSDVLTLWVLSMTDFSDPVFDPKRLGVPQPSFGSQPREGYLDSLCAADAAE